MFSINHNFLRKGMGHIAQDSCYFGTMEIVPVPLLTDNYAYLVHDAGTTVAIDPSVAQPVGAELERRGWNLSAVINTHHHWDHVGGNAELKDRFGCEVIVPRGDRERIAAATREIRGGE
jgi:hydroxyacylglutathione hydrolase